MGAKEIAGGLVGVGLILTIFVNPLIFLASLALLGGLDFSYNLYQILQKMGIK